MRAGSIAERGQRIARREQARREKLELEQHSGGMREKLE